MSVKDYYYEHFDELAPDKQFHFATRMKNYFKINDFDEFLRDNVPSEDLESILADNDYSKVNNLTLRKPYFEKYPELYGTEAALFRVHHLLVEYKIDLRGQFIKLYPVEKLYRLADQLLEDKPALRALSTWAVNTGYLTEELFPRGKNITKILAEWVLNQNIDDCEPTLFVYFCTHMVICESQFYTKDLKSVQNVNLLMALMKKASEVVAKNIGTISLDAAIEFLVCCNLIGTDYPELRVKIREICEEYKKDSPYLINYRRDKTPGSYFHTLNGAEHINALYIMSGLDS